MKTAFAAPTVSPSRLAIGLLIALAGAGCSNPKASPQNAAGGGEVLAAPPGAPIAMATSHQSASAPGSAGTGVPQATAAVAVPATAAPAGGLSIADTWAKREGLSGKPVTVRGTVVKVNNGIMGFNWFHLQDGSGKASDGTNDLTVTTDEIVKVGDIVTASGTLATRKDFGAGYVYEAILEKAAIKR